MQYRKTPLHHRWFSLLPFQTATILADILEWYIQEGQHKAPQVDLPVRLSNVYVEFGIHWNLHEAMIGNLERPQKGIASDWEERYGNW